MAASAVRQDVTVLSSNRKLHVAVPRQEKPAAKLKLELFTEVARHWKVFTAAVMGAYLSEPVLEKHSSDEDTVQLSYGASSMQGWRVSQEVRN